MHLHTGFPLTSSYMPKEEFRKIEEMGIVRCSASAAHGSKILWRPCEDYCRFNEATRADWYPVLHIQDSTANFDGARMCFKINLVRSYH